MTWLLQMFYCAQALSKTCLFFCQQFISLGLKLAEDKAENPYMWYGCGVEVAAAKAKIINKENMNVWFDNGNIGLYIHRIH